MTSGYILKCLIKKWQNEFRIHGRVFNPKKWQNEFRIHCKVFNPKNGKMNSGYIVKCLIKKKAK